MVVGFAGRRAIFHAITLSVDRDDFGMVKQPIQQGGGQHLIVQECLPFDKAGIAGQNDSSLFVAVPDDLKEMGGLSSAELGVADLINEKQAGSDIPTQPLVQETGMRRTLHITSQFGQRGKEN